MKRLWTTTDIERNVLFKELSDEHYRNKVLNKSFKKKIRQWKQKVRDIANEESDEIHYT
jgi:hypothetical protein